MIAVSYHDTVNVLQALPLAATGPFDRGAWFALLAEHGGLTPLVALASDGDEALALPLMRVGQALVPLANWYNFTWRALASPTADRPALLAAIARGLRGKAPRIVLAPLPGEDGSAAELAAAFRAAGWAVFSEACDTNHVLEIAGRSYAEYLAGRDGRLRTTLKRKAKKLACGVHSAFDPAHWQSYEEIYAQSWKPAEGKPAMLRAFAEQEGAAGRLRLGIAYHEGEPVAAQFWTVENGTAYIHKLAHVPAAEPLSAGTVLTAALMEQVIESDRVELVDFGTGDDPYKANWMEAQRPRFRLSAHDPRRPGEWPRIARAILRKLATRPSAG